MTAGIDETRRAIDGADRAFPSVIEGGRGRRKPPAPPAADNDHSVCPVAALGHLAGKFYFLDRVGQQVDLAARALGNRHELMALFGGDDTWLRVKFPKTVKAPLLDEFGVPQIGADGKPLTQDRTVDFAINKAAQHLMSRCFEAGLWGEHLHVRRPGVWSDGAEPSPQAAVHCGDKVLVGNAWHNAGHRNGNVIWAAAAATPRPGTPCDSSFGDKLQMDLQALFNFADPGGSIVVMGLLGIAYFGALTRWRAAGFLLGRAGCGKSTLLQVLVNCCPLHWYSNDTTKAGLEQGLNGRAMPCFLDETEKTGDNRAAQSLLDLVLTASGGSGTQGARGGLDGTGRRIEVVGTIVMAATAPPEMRETHLGRFAKVVLNMPTEGEDFRDQHKELIERMKARGPALWGRALASWDRYNLSLAMFRTALSAEGCAPREMDQLGALLAGWWILTHEGAPNGIQSHEGVLALAGFVRTADIVAEDSNGRRLLQYLMTKSIMLDRSSAREPIGTLIGQVLRDTGFRLDDGGTSSGTARRALLSHGIRVIAANEQPDHRGRPAPCLGIEGGIWLNHRSTELAGLFDGSDWQASRWISGLAELDHVKRSENTVSIGPLKVKHAIWIPLAALQIGGEDYQDTS